MSHEHHPPPTVGDILYETFYSAAVGGAVVALFFLLLDTLAGRPLYTPSVLGSALFLDGDPAGITPVSLEAVALMTVVHFVGFGAFGFVASWLVRALEERMEGSFLVPALVLFLLLEAGFLVASAVLAPGVLGALGQGKVLMANAATAAAMTFFLRMAHCSTEAETSVRADSGAPADAHHSPA